MNRIVRLEITADLKKGHDLKFFNGLGFHYEKDELWLTKLFKFVKTSNLLNEIKQITGKEFDACIQFIDTREKSVALIADNEHLIALGENNFSYVNIFGITINKTVVFKKNIFKRMKCQHTSGRAFTYKNIMEDSFRTKYCPECGTKLETIKL